MMAINHIEAFYYQNKYGVENYLKNFIKENISMGKYDNVTMKEYMKKKKEMLDDLGRTGGVCDNVQCKNCPLRYNGVEYYDECCDIMELENPDKVLEIVMEYEPKVDWSKVEDDTKVLVSDDKKNWNRGYFAGYDDDYIYIFIDGKTSFTVSDKGMKTAAYKYGKLYKGD